MRGGAELIVFLGLAAAVHAAVIVTAFEGAGDAPPGGAGGKANLTLAAASPELARIVGDWTAPPETAVEPQRQDPEPEDADPLKGREANSRPTAAARPDAVPMSAPDAGPGALPEAFATRPTPLLTAPFQPAAPGAGSPGSLTGLAEALPVIAKMPPAAGTGAVAPDVPVLAQSAPLPARALSPPPARPVGIARGVGPERVSGQKATATPDMVTRALPAGPSPSAMAAWGAAIRARVDARKSPPGGHWENGRALLRITVSRGGRVEDARVIESSGNPALDRAALSAVSRAGRMPKAPEGFVEASANFDLPVTFAR